MTYWSQTLLNIPYYSAFLDRDCQILLLAVMLKIHRPTEIGAVAASKWKRSWMKNSAMMWRIQSLSETRRLRKGENHVETYFQLGLLSIALSSPPSLSLSLIYTAGADDAIKICKNLDGIIASEGTTDCGQWSVRVTCWMTIDTWLNPTRSHEYNS